MNRCLRVFVLLTLLVSSTVLTATAQEATPGAAPAGGDSLLAELGYEEIRVTTDGTTNDFPAELEAGRYHVVLENQSDMDVELMVAQLPEGMTLEEVDAAFDEAEAAAPPFVPPDFFFDIVWNGGLSAFPGETKGVVLDLTPGEWTVAITAYGPEGEESTDVPVTVTVTGEMPEVEDPTGHVEIGLVDMDFMVPDSFAAGPQVWHVTNNGLQVHHIVLSRVPTGTTEEDVIELAGTFFAPPTEPEAGATPDATPVIPPTTLSFEDVEDVFFTPLLSRGQFNLYEIDLEPGTYAMICFMPDPSGNAHVMLGMVEIVTVE